MTPTGGAPWWLRALARVVPSDRRKAWLDEWIAELAHRVAAGGGRPLDVLVPLEDALALRALGWAEPGLLRDVRTAFRSVARRPGFTGVVVLTLGIAIGANTAVFSLVRGVLLRPLPWDSPEEIVLAEIGFLNNGELHPLAASEPEYLELERDATVFAALAAYYQADVNLGGIDEPVRVAAPRVTANFLEVLGVEPALGRGFSPGDDGPGADAVVLLSHGLWERSYGADAGVLGTEVLVDGRAATAIGVLPPDFEFPGGEAALIHPLNIDRTDPGGRSSHWLSLVGRLRPGLDPAGAQRELDALLERWRVERPELHALGGTHPVRLEGARAATVGDARRPLLLLMAAVGLVLLVACVNVANLLLVRGEARAREFGVRNALGASRFVLGRQLLVESLLLAGAGGIVGVGLASWGVRVLPELAGGTLPANARVSLDPVVLLFTFAVVCGTGVLFGLIPAWSGSRTDVANLLRDGRRGASAGRRRVWLRRALVTFEAAAAVTLVALAGVLGRSLVELRGQDPGFSPEGAVTFDFALASAVYPTAEDQVRFHRELDRRLLALPEVEAAGAVRSLPLSGAAGWESIDLMDQAHQTPDAHVNVDYEVVSPGYFDALAIPVVEGRALTWSDDADANPVALLNRTAARIFYPEGGAVGRTLRLGHFPDNPNPEMTVVGVVGDVRHLSLDDPPPPQLYVPRAQASANYGGMGMRFSTLVVRATTEPAVTIRAVREVVREIDPQLPIAGVRSMESRVARSLGDRRLVTFLMGGFSLVALVLGALGLYGLLAHVVAGRTREIGIRLALGARPGAVLGGVVGEAVLLVTAGSVLGVGAALVASGALEGLVYGVAPRDPVMLVGAPALLLLVGVAAALSPARRAAGVDPSEALREE